MLLEGIFALDQSQFSWECIPGRWAGNTECSFHEFCPSAHFKVGAIVRGVQPQVGEAMHLTGRLEKFPNLD